MVFSANCLTISAKCYYNKNHMHRIRRHQKRGQQTRAGGLGFELAAQFDFGTATIEQDTRKPYPEDRFVAVGLLGTRLHVLCFTPVAGGVCVISFRKANAREARDDEQTRPTD
jgi:hypothetical protein